MFATLLGPLPRPPLPPDASDVDLARARMAAQFVAGLEPLSDGRDPFDDWPTSAADREAWGAGVVERWAAAAATSGSIVKAVLPGPYSLGRRADASVGARRRRLRADIAAVNAVARDLAGRGCAYIEIHEPAAVAVGSDPTERTRFRDAQLGVTNGLAATHLSLVITGGNADAAGPETIFAAPYASHAFDLIDGPDNWRLVAAAPGERGIICGAVSTRAGSDDGPELRLWAARYAASTGGRGIARVGLGTAGGLGHLPWTVAIQKVQRLGEAARVATLPPGPALADSLDPRALDIRSAAVGRRDPGR